MSDELELAACRRTRDIVQAMLDDGESPIDRAHITSCATCRRESERVRQFTRSLAAVAAEAGDGVPNPAAVPPRRRPPVPFGGFVRLATVGTLATAVAAGILVASVIGIRPPLADGPDAFSDAADARGQLAILGLVCADVESGTECQATAPTHVHRVTLLEEGGRVVEVVAVIESIEGKPLDIRGADVFLGRIAAAVVGEAGQEAAAAWVREAYQTCDGDCSADLDDLRLQLSRDSGTISLRLRER